MKNGENPAINSDPKTHIRLMRELSVVGGKSLRKALKTQIYSDESHKRGPFRDALSLCSRFSNFMVENRRFIVLYELVLYNQ